MTLPIDMSFGLANDEPILEDVASYRSWWPAHDATFNSTGAFIEGSRDDHFVEISEMSYPGTALILRQCPSATSALSSDDSWRLFLSGISVCASGQISIFVETPRPKFQSTEHMFPAMLCSLKISDSDDRGFALPGVHLETIRRMPTQSLGDKIEPYARFLRESLKLVTNMRERRGIDSQERYMFDFVAPFIEKYGRAALPEFDEALPSMPRSVKYYYPFLLGHLNPDNGILSNACLAYLNKYAESADADIREGAIEALDHLNAA